jgi:hypothetical protein
MLARGKLYALLLEPALVRPIIFETCSPINANASQGIELESQSLREPPFESPRRPYRSASLNLSTIP